MKDYQSIVEHVTYRSAMLERCISMYLTGCGCDCDIDHIVQDILSDMYESFRVYYGDK